MHIATKISGYLAGISAAVLILAATPITVRASADFVSASKDRQIGTMAFASNPTYDVYTEVDCSMHSIAAMVTNKSGQPIIASVSFNQQQPGFPSGLPTQPGQTRAYYYSFSGNHITIPIDILVQGVDPVRLTPTVHCVEPVTFTVSEVTSENIQGELTNNNTLVTQTQVVFIKVDNGPLRTEVLMPGQTKPVTLPLPAGSPGTMSFVTIATVYGYESNYGIYR